MTNKIQLPDAILEIKRLRKEYGELRDRNYKELDKLEQQIKEANEVIEFYGSGDFSGKLFKRYPNLGDKARNYINKFIKKELGF